MKVVFVMNNFVINVTRSKMSFLFTCCDTDNVLTILSKSKPFGLFLLSILILMAYPLLCLARIVDLDKIIYLFVVYLVSLFGYFSAIRY